MAEGLFLTAMFGLAIASLVYVAKCQQQLIQRQRSCKPAHRGEVIPFESITPQAPRRPQRNAAA